MKIKRFNENTKDAQSNREYAIDINIVKAHDSTPAYINIINKMIRKGDGKVWVNNIDGNIAYIRSWRFDLLGDAVVPVESLKGFSIKSWNTNNVANRFDL